MANKLLALGGAACALLILHAVGPAEARGGHGGGHGGHSHAAHSMGGPVHSSASMAAVGSHHHHHHHRVFVGAPLVYGYGYYGDGCYWLRRRALYTGSGYWWNRYYACVDGYGY
jgi:hypothetical protein